MTLDDTKILAKAIAESSYETNEIKQNISPDDSNANLPLFILESIKINGAITIATHTYSTAFVIDHPVYGFVDSPSLYIDGGYTGAATTVYTVIF
jgi:hypothetical protein